MISPKICYYLFGLRIPLFISLFILAAIFRKQISLLLKNRILPYLIICIPSTVVFIKIFLNDPFFLSDDFDHLLISFNSSYLEIFRRAISPEGIWIGHRFITGFWLFKFIYDFFGANIYPFISVIFLLHLVNIILLYQLIRIFVKDKVIPVFFSFVFGFYYLNWNSNIHELLGGLFVLITLIFAIKRIHSGKNNLKYSLISIASYIPAVFSKEITFLVFPTIILLYLYRGEFKKVNFKFLGSFFAAFSLYTIFFATGFLRYFGYTSGYKMGFDVMTISGNLWKYLTMYSNAFTGYGFLIILTVTAGAVVSFRKSGWLSLIFIAGFLTILFPTLLFVDRTSFYYIYIPGLLLFTGLAKIFEDSFSLIRNYIVKVLILLFCLIFIFDVDVNLRDNCFLIVSPWIKPQKTEFLSFISKINGFEKTASPGQKMIFVAGDLANGVLTQYLNEGKPVDLIRVFLYPRGSGYNYTYFPEKKELVVEKE